MLTIWGRRSSSNVQSVMWCIGELGLKYERIDAGFIYGGNDTAEFKAMNPNGLIPVVKDGHDAPLFESGAILRYLATRYGEAPFWPKQPCERAQIDKWAEWAKVNVTPSFTVPIFWQLIRIRPQDRDPAVTSQALDRLGRLLAIAETRIAEHGYLAGREFTLADILLGHLLYRYYDLAIERTQLPALAAYYERLTQRPAYREHVMVPYDELRVA